MKKWILRIALLLIVLIVGGFFLAKSFITRDFIVSKIEKSINCRMQLKDIDINLYGFSGTVDLDGVILARRDEMANSKVPHDEREVIEDGEIHLEKASFDISIWEIFSKRILVERIVIDGVILNATLYENGDTSLEELFAKPAKLKKAKVKKFNARENEKFVTTISEVSLNNVDVNLVVEKTQLSVKGRGGYVQLLDIDVNPKMLETVNDAKIRVGGEFDLRSLDTGHLYGKVITAGESTVTLFNSENGDLEPDMVMTLTVSSDSYLSARVPALGGIWSAADGFSRMGMSMLKLPEKAKFKNDQSVKVAYKLGRATLLDPLSIKVGDWELEALERSWLGTGDDQHLLGVKLHIGKSVSNKLGGMLGGDMARGVLGKLVGGDGLGAFFEDGKLAIHVESSGDLSDPKIRLKNEIGKPAEKLIDGLLGDDKKDLKKVGKDLLRNFLK